MKQDPQNSLDEAAADWLPEQLRDVQKAQTAESPTPTSSGTVTLIDDPFHIPTIDISESQNDTEELDLDQDLELMTDPDETEATFSSLQKAMTQEQEQQITTLLELAPDDAQAKAELLAQQIAEDEAQKAHAHELEQDAEASIDLTQLVLSEMMSCVETLLFMSDKPLSAEKIQQLLDPEISFSLLQEAITALRDRYQDVSHGIEIVEVAGGVQLRTKPGRASLAKKLARVQVQRLSSGAMESLAIIAYKQPVLKDEIDKIRGVDSSHFIRTLLDKKLIRISGRSELPGRPMLYTTTPEFMELFGLKDLDALPSLREIEQMVPMNQSQQSGEVDPRVLEMQKLVAEMKSHSQSIMDYDPKEDDKILQDIRERVNSIPISTPYLEAQKAAQAKPEEIKPISSLLES